MAIKLVFRSKDSEVSEAQETLAVRATTVDTQDATTVEDSVRPRIGLKLVVIPAQADTISEKCIKAATTIGANWKSRESTVSICPLSPFHFQPKQK